MMTDDPVRESPEAPELVAPDPDRIRNPDSDDEGQVIGPTRQLPPGAWSNTDRGARVFYTEHLSRAQERNEDPEVEQHSREPRRPSIRLHVAATEEGGRFDLRCLTGEPVARKWAGSAGQRDAARYPFHRSRGRNWPGTARTAPPQNRTQAQRQSIIFIENKQACSCLGGPAPTEGERQCGFA